MSHPSRRGAYRTPRTPWSPEPTPRALIRTGPAPGSRLVILHEEGPKKVTLRRIAALDMGPASLPVQVRDTENHSKALSEHAETSRTVLSTLSNGPHLIRLGETVLGLLPEDGISDRAAAWGLDLLRQAPLRPVLRPPGRDPRCLRTHPLVNNGREDESTQGLELYFATDSPRACGNSAQRRKDCNRTVAEADARHSPGSGLRRP